MTKKIIIPIAQGFEEIELVSVVDILRRAGVSVTLASLSVEKLVFGAHCISIMADETFESCSSNDFDGIVLVGGMQGVKNMGNHRSILSWLQDFDTSKKLIGAICAAPLILDQLKMLRDDFCCYPGCERMMHFTQAKRLNKPFSINKHIITATGPAFAIDFAIEIVKKLKDGACVQKLREELLLKN